MKTLKSLSLITVLVTMAAVIYYGVTVPKTTVIPVAIRQDAAQDSPPLLEDKANSETMLSAQGSENPLAGDPFLMQKFWIKVIFSFMFCFSALYIILSQKFDDQTKKWAYSVLTLIAGVWIGTIS